MSDLIVPPYLTPVYQALESVRVRAVPDHPEERDGTPKTSRFFPGCRAWKMQFTLVMSETEGADGVVEREVRRQPITIWAPERPDVSVGDKIRITGLMAGAVEGSLFLQATGVEKLEDTHEIL